LSVGPYVALTVRTVVCGPRFYLEPQTPLLGRMISGELDDKGIMGGSKMVLFKRPLIKGLLLSVLSVLLVAPAANAVSIFAVASGGAAVDGGTLQVAAGSTTSIDVYMDTSGEWSVNGGYEVYLYDDGSTLTNPTTVGSLGNIQAYGYSWWSSACEPDCGTMALIGSIDVTVGVAGTGLDSKNGYAAIDGWDPVYAPDVRLVNASVVPEPGTAILMGLGLIGMAAAGRRKHDY